MAASPETLSRSPVTVGIGLGAILRRIAVVGVLALVAFLLFFAFLNNPTSFTQVTIIGLIVGLVYALIALGYTLVYGILELINFAHGDLFMLGAALAFALSVWFGVTGAGSVAGWLVILASLAICMTACGMLNVAIEQVAYKPLRNAPKLAPLITAIGMSFVLQNVGLFALGPAKPSVSSLFPKGSVFTLFDGRVGLGWPQIIVLVLVIPLLAGLSYVVARTRAGKAMRAVSQDAEAAGTMGIDVNRTIAFTFLLGGTLAGAAGVVYAHYTTQVSFDLGFRLGLYAFTAAVLGGIGNLRGAVLGALVIGLVEQWSIGLTFENPLGTLNLQPWPVAMVFTVLIVILVFKPEGLLGQNVQEKV